MYEGEEKYAQGFFFFREGTLKEKNFLEGPGAERREPPKQVFKNRLGMYGLHSSGL